MSNESSKETRELIEEFHRKNRGFRIANSIFMAAVVASLIFGYFLIYDNFNRQSKQRADGLVKINEELDKKIDDLTNRLQCLGNFFAQPDRQNLIVKDLNTCFTVRLSDGTSIFLSNPGSVSSNQNNTSNEATSQEQNTNETTPDQNNSDEIEIQPPEVGSGEADKPPKEVLGVSVCIPFTDICLR